MTDVNDGPELPILIPVTDAGGGGDGTAFDWSVIVPGAIILGAIVVAVAAGPTILEEATAFGREMTRDTRSVRR